MLVGRYAGERVFLAPHAAHALIEKGDAKAVDYSREETVKILMKETVVTPGGKLHAGTVYEVPDGEAQGHISTGLAETVTDTVPAGAVPKTKAEAKQAKPKKPKK